MTTLTTNEKRFTAILLACFIGSLIAMATKTLNAQVAHSWTEIATYVIIAPAYTWLALDFYLNHNYWFSALFGLLALERFVFLASLASAHGSSMVDVKALVPVALVLAAVLTRITIGRLLARIITRWGNHGSLGAPTRRTNAVV